MGYRRNRLASGLRTNRTMTVGVVIPDITNALFPPIVRGIESVLEPEGYASILVNTDNDAEREERLVDVLVERGVDGILHAAPLRDDATVARLRADGVPVVTLNRRIDAPGVPFVVSDEAGGIRLAVRHLVEHGHTRIGHLAGPEHLSTGHARREAFLRALAAHGFDARAAPVSAATRYTEDEGRRCAAELLERAASGDGAPFTGLVCANDRLALGAVALLGERGLACPRDVSVTGFNDMPFVDLVAPRLTTVRVRQFEAGSTAARLLLSAIAGQMPHGTSGVVLPVDLVARDSVTAPAAQRRVPAVTGTVG